MTFDQLPAGTKVRLYTLAGQEVRALDAPAGSAAWDLRNEEGQQAASGYYFFVAVDPQGKRSTGKFALIR
jgi:hypothetical protein